MKSVRVITHSGSFHADEVFAIATLKMMLGRGAEFEIVRTRDAGEIATGDYVVDVGGVYDESKNRFDHHQEGGAGGRENGIDYSSFGLVWKTYGEIVSGSKEVANLIDKRMVSPIDAIDNGIDLFEQKIPGVMPYDDGAEIASFRPSSEETPQDYNLAFQNALNFATVILEREIIHTRGEIAGQEKIRAMIASARDPRIAEIDHMYAWEPVTYEFPELLYVYYQSDPEVWRLKAVRKRQGSFESKKPLPENWGGKSGEELAKITGVEDSIFCHRKLFLCGAKSKEGVLKLAELALKN